jgi:hypothetical protein
VLKEKMVSPNTIVLTLQKYKQLFERVEKWVYQLNTSGKVPPKKKTNKKKTTSNKKSTTKGKKK